MSTTDKINNFELVNLTSSTSFFSGKIPISVKIFTKLEQALFCSTVIRLQSILQRKPQALKTRVVRAIFPKLGERGQLRPNTVREGFTVLLKWCMSLTKIYPELIIQAAEQHFVYFRRPSAHLGLYLWVRLLLTPGQWVRFPRQIVHLLQFAGQHYHKLWMLIAKIPMRNNGCQTL